jgi:hypothetical protein
MLSNIIGFALFSDIASPDIVLGTVMIFLHTELID